MSELKEYEVWIEGYEVPDFEVTHQGKHQFLGKVSACSWEQACAIAVKENMRKHYPPERLEEKFKLYFDPVELSFWHCRLFDNEEDAAKKFG